ncbi:MAG: alanine dehydrogenase [Hyphomicrobiales bacterium]
MDESITANIKSKYFNELMPLEEVLEKSSKNKEISIGIPKEDITLEKRIALTPEAIKALSTDKVKVYVESNAGAESGYSDLTFSENGAIIVKSKEEVFKSDIIIKIAPLTFEELNLISSGKTVISSLSLPTQNREYFEKLVKKKITALAYEYIQDKDNSFPVVKSMSEIIGNTTILLAARYLSHPKYGKGILLGGFPGIAPSEVVIIGAGTVGEYAARTASGLGASIKIFDSSSSRLRRIHERLGYNLYTSVFDYTTLKDALLKADAVIAAKHVAFGKTPCLIPEELVKQMKPNSIIIDVSIDQGGCFETSIPTNLNQPIFKKHNITHYCVPNIASGVPHTATKALSNIISPILQKIIDSGGILNNLKNDYWLCKGVYVLSGIITNKYIGNSYRMPYQDIDLLMAAFQQ